MTKSWLAGPSLNDESSAAERIRRAEEAIAGLKANFASWVRADIDLIERHLATARSTLDARCVAEELEALRRIAHNIKGQGGTFGCDGLSAAAAELDSVLKVRSTPADMPTVAELVSRLQAAALAELP